MFWGDLTKPAATVAAIGDSFAVSCYVVDAEFG